MTSASGQHRVFLYDTTLRDGSQGANVNFSASDKVKIVEKLDKLGIHYIEPGFAGSNKVDDQVFRQLSTMDLGARICAFGMTRRPSSQVEEDPSIKALLKAGTPAVTIVGKAWDRHVANVLRTTPEENLAMIADSTRYLKSQGREVIFDAEHFFDGYKQNPKYALDVLKAAQKERVDWIVLCDTNGGVLPSEVERIVDGVRGEITAPLGIHCHDDSGVSQANSLVAVVHGASQVHGTINGLGERCGNCNLTTLIPNLKLKMGFTDVVTDDQLKRLKEISTFIYEVANMKEEVGHPYVGANAFTHKGGMHSDAILKDVESYEHVDPGLVGNERRISISDLAGRAAIFEKAREIGIDLGKEDERGKAMLANIKALQGDGFAYESADASLELLMKGTAHDPANPGQLKHKFFTLERFRVITEVNGDGQPRSEATIKVRVNDRDFLTAAEGNGPVNALDNALRKSLEHFYPEIKGMVLNDYKVRITDQAGTGSKVRVLIETKDAGKTWTTVGAHENILWASWIALADSICFKLLKEVERKGFGLK
ncbi:MAG: citramalate synthase [Candidatus Lokiarchaeota archaeon]|nr:citramalate synthase [Candidatus Lokiarchaeota archaeon]